VAEFERDRIRVRTRLGIARETARGAHRPASDATPSDAGCRSRPSQTRPLVERGGARASLFVHYAATDRSRMTEGALQVMQLTAEEARILRSQTVRLRRMLKENVDLARKLAALEKKYDAQFKIVFDAIRELMEPPVQASRSIGFKKTDP
jgi:hypothetical protein